MDTAPVGSGRPRGSGEARARSSLGLLLKRAYWAGGVSALAALAVHGQESVPTPEEKPAPQEEVLPQAEPKPQEEVEPEGAVPAEVAPSDEASPDEDSSTEQEPGAADSTLSGEEGSSEDSGSPVHGRVFLRYRGRGRTDEYDQDIYVTLNLDVGDPEQDPWTGHLHAYAALDIDDLDDPGFFNVSDTYDGEDVRLYQAYADANQIDGIERLRLGRQQIFETPVLVWFDGALLETEASGDDEVSIGLYGGVPVHIFESSPSGDAVAGGFLEARPWKGGRMRMDYVYFEDESPLGNAQNDLLNLAWWQSLDESLDVDASYSLLDGKERDYRVAATLHDARTGLSLRVTHYELLETQEFLVLEFDPLFDSLQALFPYEQSGLVASAPVSEDVLLEGGFDVRRVTAADDVGEFNRDFERYYLSVTFSDFPAKGVDFTATGESWNNGGSDIRTWGADLSAELSSDLDASLGTYYSLYKYDYFFEQERDDVRTYYARLRHELGKNLSLNVAFEYEDNDFDDFRGVRLGLSWRF